MSEAASVLTPMLTAWRADLEVAICENCQWRLLVPSGNAPKICPNCCHGPLETMPGGLPHMPHPYPPELAAPFELSPQKLDEAIRAFTAGIPFPPRDFSPAKLRARAQPVFMPMWLVDSNVSAQWHAEAGFNYEVVSHQEHYDGNEHQWLTREVKEPRLRWEPRLGRLNRAYQNVSVPAVEDHARLLHQLGGFSLKQVLPYDPERIQGACVRLPDNAPKEIWNDAVLAFQKTAQAECQQACESDHLRNFNWKAQFTQPNWTLLLLPIYATHYIDDEGKLRPILIHGQTGKSVGKSRSSIRQASHISLGLLIASLVIFVLGWLLDHLTTSIAVINSLSTYIILIGIAGIIASAIPFLIAWDFNHKQTLEERKDNLRGAV